MELGEPAVTHLSAVHITGFKFVIPCLVHVLLFLKTKFHLGEASATSLCIFFSLLCQMIRSYILGCVLQRSDTHLAGYPESAGSKSLLLLPVSCMLSCLSSTAFVFVYVSSRWNNLCLLIKVLIFRVIMDVLGFTSTNPLFVFYLSHLFYASFTLLSRILEEN